MIETTNGERAVQTCRTHRLYPVGVAYKRAPLHNCSELRLSPTNVGYSIEMTDVFPEGEHRGVIDRSLVVLDFDGTAADIVDDPADAVLNPLIEQAIAKVHALGCHLAFISGRPMSFLRRQITEPVGPLVALYGLQRLDEGLLWEHPSAAAFRAPMLEAFGRAKVALPDLFIEDKDGLAVTVHWRSDSSRNAHATVVVGEIAAELGLRTAPARLAIEMLPPIDVSKTSALSDLTHDYNRVAYAGDDSADVAPLQWLRDEVEQGRLLEVIRIAVASSESPPSLIEAADLVVDSPSMLAGVISDIVTRWDGYEALPHVASAP